jgi:hypothetical protein
VNDRVARQVRDMRLYQTDIAFRREMEKFLAYRDWAPEQRPSIHFDFAEEPDVWLIGSHTTAAGRNHGGLLLAWSAIGAALSGSQPTPWGMFYGVKRSASKGVKAAGEWVSSFCPPLGDAIGKRLHFRGDRLVYEPAPDASRFITRFHLGSSS